MNTTIQKMNNELKIDSNALEILAYMGKLPDKVFSVDRLFKELAEIGWNSNYATIFRKVDLLVKQGFLIKKKYGMANQLRINLKNQKTILLLSFYESEKRESFLGSVKGSIRSTVSQLAERLENVTTIKFVLIFGSYAKGKANKNSDLDILIMTSTPRQDILRKISAVELRGSLKINPIIVTAEEHCEMLTNTENNVGKEALANHIILFGEYEYWRDISKCCRKEK